MSYAAAVARMNELEARLGRSTLSANIVDNRVFDKVLQNAQSRFNRGPERIATASGGFSAADESSDIAAAALARSGGRSSASGLTPQLNASIERIARKHGVPAALVKAVARAESNFRADAVSGAGAQGLMQLMPATGRGLGVTDPFNAEQSIEGGTRYLKNALRMFDGDTKLALAAYNAGPGAVRQYGGIPPYSETQNYVRKVMAYAREFGLHS